MIKRFITFGVEKNILNHIFLLFLVVLAIFSYQRIPKEIFPPSNLDAIAVSGVYAGASPDTLDKIAVQNLEDEITNLNDIDRVESVIRNGAFNITVYLKDGADRSEILDEVKDIISTQRSDLPTDMDEPIAKIMTTTYPLVSIAVASDKSVDEILKVADDLKSDLSKIQDLSDIFIRGDADKELLIKIDEKKVLAYGLRIDSVYSAISNLSQVFPVGIIKQGGSHLFINTYGGEKKIKALEDTYLDIQNQRVRLGNLASVDFDLEDRSEVSHFNGKKNISISINKAKTGNAITLVKEIKKILKTYEKEYKGYTFKTYSDTSIWIRNRLNTVISNIIFGLILVALSVYVFISGRIAAVVAMGIPVSFMIGLICADWMGYSLNMLSLLGALIALGMLVDEAIVVAENIYRHLEEGDNPKEAAIKGAYEVFPAVLTATATTIFAFLPLLIMSGEMGIFVRILPIMISILLLSSLFEAFFFLPLHAKEILKVKTKEKKNESWWKFFNRIYKKNLSFLFIRKKTVLISFVLFSFLCISVMATHTKFQLFPDFDTTEIYISGKVDINYAVADTQNIISEVEQVLLKNLNKEDISSITSVSGFMLDAKYRPHIAENNFHIFVNLHERKPQNVFNKYINPYLSPEYDDSDMIRKKSAHEVLAQIKKLTAKFTQDKRFDEFRAIVPGAGIVKNDVEIAFTSKDINKIKKALKIIETKLHSIDGVFNIQDDLQPGKRELKLRVNHYGQLLGFSEKLLSSYLRPYFFKAESGKMFYNGELIKIRTQEKLKDTYDAIKDFSLPVPNSNERVRLSEVADFTFIDGYANIYKEDSERISSIFASLDKTKVTSAQMFKKIAPELEALEKEGVDIKIKGEEQESRKVQEEMVKAAIIAIFLIFIALVWMFDSLLLSFIILTSIPLSLFGIYAGHLIMGINLTMPGLLGVVGLCGVVVNDGIIMMDFLKKTKKIEEVIEYATLRLRPILLTSITTILGLSTLMFFASGQAIILQPMAVSLGFGIAWATVLNLFYIPLVYTIIKGKKLYAN